MLPLLRRSFGSLYEYCVCASAWLLSEPTCCMRQFVCPHVCVYMCVRVCVCLCECTCAHMIIGSCTHRSVLFHLQRTTVRTHQCPQGNGRHSVGVPSHLGAEAVQPGSLLEESPGGPARWGRGRGLCFSSRRRAGYCLFKEMGKEASAF